jgi:hypothetical protein
MFLTDPATGKYAKPTSFRNAVAMMREAQKEYFGSHTQSKLTTALHFERMVDEWLKRHPEPEDIQQPLMPPTEEERLRDLADHG